MRKGIMKELFDENDKSLPIDTYYNDDMNYTGESCECQLKKNHVFTPHRSLVSYIPNYTNSTSSVFGDCLYNNIPSFSDYHLWELLHQTQQLHFRVTRLEKTIQIITKQMFKAPSELELSNKYLQLLQQKSIEHQSKLIRLEANYTEQIDELKCELEFRDTILKSYQHKSSDDFDSIKSIRTCGFLTDYSVNIKDSAIQFHPFYFKAIKEIMYKYMQGLNTKELTHMLATIFQFDINPANGVCVSTNIINKN